MIGIVSADVMPGVEWSKTFGGTDWDVFNSVGVCADGGYVLSGSTMSQGAGSGDGWVVKIESECPDSDGDSWDDCHELEFGTNPNAVDTDGDGIWDPQDPNPWIAGTTTSTTTTTTMTTLTITTTPSRAPAQDVLIGVICMTFVTYITSRLRRI